jgi:broad specificity phosphatase PhoE
MPETHILIVRHPETEANLNGRFVGQGESPFTAVGRVQARRLPKKIASFQPDHIWTSPLLRARVVAERASRLTGVPLTVERRLIELDFGSAHALTWDEIAEAGIPFNYRSAEQPVAPGGESRNDLEDRVGGLVDEVHALGGHHVLVCHAGVMRAALARVLGLHGDQLWAFSIHNAQLAYVRFAGDHGMLEEFRRG